ncbi:hypothetical protein JOC34_000031 [Virgibacillus halotolerans]|nr:hypothetical protein [Virgibacillus halotolerans]
MHFTISRELAVGASQYIFADELQSGAISFYDE